MKEQRRFFQKINKINEKTELSEIQKVEFGAIEDLIKERTKEADKLWNKVNGWSATARSVSAGVKNAQKEYNEAEEAFEKFKKSEIRYNETLDYVDDLYRQLKSTGFKQLNDYADLYDADEMTHEDFYKMVAEIKIGALKDIEHLQLENFTNYG